MGRSADNIERNTKETEITISIDLDGGGKTEISTGIPFFDHMLTLFSAHGFFDLTIQAKGDLEVDSHHTVEDVGLVLGEALSIALGDREGIRRFGYAITPMDESLASVTIDLSNRPFLVFNVPADLTGEGDFSIQIAKEFFRSFAVKGGMNLHINVNYGENEHHTIESVFKSLGRALGQAVSFDERITGARSTKGCI